MRRRFVVALVMSVAATVGLVGFTATPASAYCIDTGIPGAECVWVCPPGFTCPM
ncbi:MAG: hypothetical protein ACRDKT_11420 [Actinomycetota bacterium]